MGKKDIQFEIKEHVGVLSEKSNVIKELNLIKWGKNEPTHDIRGWGIDEDGVKCPFKGIVLNKNELITLKELLADVDLEVQQWVM